MPTLSYWSLAEMKMLDGHLRAGNITMGEYYAILAGEST